MRWVLYGGAAAAAIYAGVRMAWSGDSAEVGIGLACVTAAVCLAGGAIVEAIDRQRPKPVSRDNGGRRDEAG